MRGAYTAFDLVKLLFADMFMNVSLARLPYQFKKLGAQCYGLGFSDRLILQSDNYVEKFEFPGSPKDLRFSQIVNGLSNAVKNCHPDYLMTIDETLMRGLLQLRANIRTTDKPRNENVLRILKLLEKSLVQDPRLYQRHQSLTIAKEAGFPIPKHETASSDEELIEKSNQFKEPHFIKVSFAAGGTGVIPVLTENSREQLSAKIKNAGYHITDIQTALIQSKSAGEELTVSFCAWKGQLLGYTVVRPLQKLFEKGPSSVIENLYRPDYLEPLSKLVKSLNLSGFGGLDIFETDPHKLPEVIEVNLRATHTVPSSKMLGNDLVTLFYQCLNDERNIPKTVSHIENEKSIALFPDAIMSDPNSDYLKKLPLDISWEDESINRFLFRQIYKLQRKSN